MSNVKHHNLSILLLKDGFDTFDDAIKNDSRIKKIDIASDSNSIGSLYIKSSAPNPPKWSSFFEKVVDIRDIGVNKNVSAVLLLGLEDKVFAVTFGQGRYLLHQDSWVERFGLKVALNSIGHEKIRTIDKKTFDAISRQSKEQASKETDARDFGLDVEQDLLRAVTGIPKNLILGKRMYGMDSLSVSTDIKIDKIDEFVSRIYGKYLDNSYKKDFPWVDHISEVKDKTVVEELDKFLISRIASRNLDRIWMAVPEIIQWDQVGGFCFKMGKLFPEFQDIHLPDFLDSLSDSDLEHICKETFSKKYVHCIHVEGYLLHKWQTYKCLYGELEKDGNTYLLSGGKWYLVAEDFVANVNDSYMNLKDYTGMFPKYIDDSESKYNERTSQELSDQFALMDRKNIAYGGGYSKIEFCDLISKNGDLVHVKRYGSSSILSHLFAQGRISGELFQMDQEFREAVNIELPEGFKIKNVQERPKIDEYQIVFAIVSDISGDLVIPFFSRLNLKNTARNLQGLGFRVTKSKIEVDESKALIKKFRKRRKKK